MTHIGSAALDDLLAAAEVTGVTPDPADAAAAMCGLSLPQRELVVRERFATQTSDVARFITAMHRALKYEGR